MGNQNYSIMMQSLNTDELYEWAPQARGRRSRAQVPEVQDRLHRPGDEEPAHQPGDRSRQGGGGRPERHADPERALRRARAEVVVDDLRRRPRSTACCSSSIRSTRSRPTRCEKIAFKTPTGALVPLESVVDFKETVGPQSINHSGQLPSVSVSFGLRPGVSLGAATGARQAGRRPRCCRRRSRPASRARPRCSSSR